MRDITYNARGQVSKIPAATTSPRVTYNEQRGVLNGLETRDGVGTSAPLLLGLAYARNAAGMITGVTAAGGTTAQNNARSWTYTYDGIGQLLTADRQDTAGVELTYAYDAASNMTKNTALCGGNGLSYPTAGPAAVRPHAPITICGTNQASTPSYDANGNTLTYAMARGSPLSRAPHL
jgi:YD repeat-containing protein